MNTQGACNNFVSNMLCMEPPGLQRLTKATFPWPGGSCARAKSDAARTPTSLPRRGCTWLSWDFSMRLCIHNVHPSLHKSICSNCATMISRKSSMCLWSSMLSKWSTCLWCLDQNRTFFFFLIATSAYSGFQTYSPTGSQTDPHVLVVLAVSVTWPACGILLLR